MRIGIDGGSWTNRRGYGRFLQEIAKGLSENGESHEYVMFLDAAGAECFTPLPGFQTRVVALHEPIGTAASNDGNRSMLDLARMGRAVAKERLEVFLFPTVYSYFPLWTNIPNVVGIHDTIADRNPAFAFAGKRQEYFWKAKVRMAIWRASLVLTVSAYSGQCLESVYQVPSEKIRIVHEAASSRFCPPPDQTQREEYILYVGGISPNKNLATLIQAFGDSAARKKGWRLLLAGDVSDDGFRGCYNELVCLVSERSLDKSVEFLGYIPDGRLVDLYQRAGLFVLPSFDEGFGLPAVEAMACGTPVIASSGNAVAEVVGSAGICVSATDTEAFTKQIDRLAAEPELRARMSEQGVRRAERFTWKQAASDLLQVLQEARKQSS